MSEQIQSVLEQMEDKFERSFSQSDLDQDPPQLKQNPESPSKNQEVQKNQQSQENLFEPSNFRDIPPKQLNSQITQQSIPSGEKNPSQDNSPIRPEENLFDLRKINSEQTFSSTITPPLKNAESSDTFEYRELTMKLEKALSKISSEQMFANRNHKNSKSSAMLDRFQMYENKRNKEIERKRQQIEERKLNQTTGKPQINSHSLRLMADMQPDPLYLRYERILEQKRKNIEENAAKNQEKKESQYQQFKQQFDQQMERIRVKHSGKLRSPEEYYQEMEVWAANRQNNISAKKQQLEQKQKTKYSQRPLINSKSEKILKINDSRAKRVPIHLREPASKPQKIDPECTFQPKINKNAFYKKSTYYAM